MELKYIVMTIIKILISVPSILMVYDQRAAAASLMGGHFNNNENATSSSQEDTNNSKYHREKQLQYKDYGEEEIPDPSALILPGYNLPDNIFNKGKPFYLEKNPLTGKVDFESKTSLSNMEDEFEYVDEEPSPDLYDKSNINRKDGSLSSHKLSDVNQLTPNFHDFLNLPVKYNPEKYVYPLISSSYANTKIQGNINKYHNHKNYIITTYKPQYYTVKTPFFNPNNSPLTTSSTTSTTSKSTTTPSHKNLINLNQFIVDQTKNDFYQTTQSINDISTKYPPPTTTKRSLSLFEQLFGEYDEITTKTLTKPPTKITTTNKPVDFENVLTGSEMGHESAYEYEDDYGSFEVHSTTFYPITTTTATTTTATTTTEATTKKEQIEYDYEEELLNTTTFSTTTSTTTRKPLQVTSMQLGEKHFSTADTRPPIIAVTQQNLKEQLNKEKVHYQPVPNTNSIRILPNEDTVSFVVGNHQHVDGGYETQFKESPYDNNPFRPIRVQAEDEKDTVNYVIQTKPEFIKPVFSQSFSEIQKIQPEVGGSSINIQPIKTSEASLSIGVPIGSIKKIPGQVVDENLGNEKIEFPKTGTGAKIVFPDVKEDALSTIIPNLQPPPLPSSPTQNILHLNSKPMYHQLPSDLTPPIEQDIHLLHMDRPRPPWDPRPGHFHNGKPEYLRPPRPQLKQSLEIYKRMDKLPNILPQFRPNAKVSNGPPHYYDNINLMKNGYLRQPLLDRPSNRPVLFYEKLVPPAPPKNLHNLRKVSILEEELKMRNPEKRHEHFEFYQHQTPPTISLSNRRSGIEPTIETLQMIHAKQYEQTTMKTVKNKENTEKPLYVVYPVNSPPIKLDALDSNKKETVVIGTRAELPLPPSKINQEFAYESPQDRNDSPILKPHSKVNFPLKSNFPYPMERPDISTTTVTSNNIEKSEWGKVTSSQVTSSKINYKNPNQISATLKTFTEKPIAIAYTPTESYKEDTEKYSMPNYAGPVISEIRPSFNDRRDSEITLKAVMRTGNQPIINKNYQVATFTGKKEYIANRKDGEEVPQKLDFQAPFQASMNVDGMAQGWTVLRKDGNKTKTETTTISIAATSEFDIENFKPELYGGFKPIYNYSDSIASNDTLPARKEERDRRL
ncbi:hypothetical protein FQA39_LY17401 [Lamprigera yunnana]|nr:hypothetical protein FQA39_LY17401 [Lamprigera yunnana]